MHPAADREDIALLIILPTTGQSPAGVTVHWPLLETFQANRIPDQRSPDTLARTS